ncbi:MAG: zinc ABC transporter substrate-binding protein [Hyphomicrobiaceae bacterium]|nr:MAG: zinc ABC transporter substrate-binding protein [Hyphomicrobiaceae bacterium]
MHRKIRLAALAVGCLMIASSSSPAAAKPKVVVTIKPLHALVAGVMVGVGTPDLLVKGASSPHTYALKPSDARLLNGADLFFRMSERVEPFTVKVIKSLPRRVQVVTLRSAPGLKLLEIRTGTTFERHAHGGDHKHDRKHDHNHDQDHADEADTIDGHAWLDPDNAKAMVVNIEQALSAKDPANAAVYKANAQALTAKLDALAAELEQALQPVAGKAYIVFHDAFQYFEKRYGLNAVGSISVSPEVPPSAKRLTELRKKVTSLTATCVFAEPQFDTRLVKNLVEGTPVRTGTLDPEGGRLEPGPELYFALMRGLAAGLRGCLAPPA